MRDSALERYFDSESRICFGRLNFESKDFCIDCLDEIPDRRAFVLESIAEPSEGERLA
jgi:hypothetical protein